jgi:trigger factor
VGRWDPDPRPTGPILPSMNVTVTPAAKSTVLVEVELPDDALRRAVDEAVRELSRRTRVPGFRPGKVPRPVLERFLGPQAILDEAVDRLVSRTYREVIQSREITPLAEPSVEVVQAEEGKPLVFRARVPVAPQVFLGDYRNFNFVPEIEPVDEAAVERVLADLREEYATLVAVEDRGAAKGDHAVVAVRGGPFGGERPARIPIVVGDDRIAPGFDAHLLDRRVGEVVEFDLQPADEVSEVVDERGEGDEATASAPREPVHYQVELVELREKVLPPLDDEFARLVGPYPSLAALREEVRSRLQRLALDRARHRFGDRIVEYAVANATVELPDVLVDEELEVIHDEFRDALEERGLSEELYLRLTKRSPEELHQEWRPLAERRAKTLLVLSRIAEVEGVEPPPELVEEQLAEARRRYAGNPRLLRYVESERGRRFILDSLRRSLVVERLIDEWLAAHPDHPALPHYEASRPAGLAESSPSPSVAATPGEAVAPPDSHSA